MRIGAAQTRKSKVRSVERRFQFCLPLFEPQMSGDVAMRAVSEFVRGAARAEEALGCVAAMDEDELEEFYSEFPYREVFRAYRERRDGAAFRLFAFFIGDAFDAAEFANGDDVGALVECLGNEETCDEALRVLGEVLRAVDSGERAALLKEFRIMEKIDLASPSVRGNFVMDLCYLRSDCAFPYVETMILSKDEVILSFAIRCCSVLAIMGNRDGVLSEILPRIDVIYNNIADVRVKEDLFNFLSLNNNLPNYLIGDLMGIMKVEENVSVFKSIANVFTVNALNWKEYVPCNEFCSMIIEKTKNQPFSILKPCFISLLKYYDFEHLQNYDMFNLLIVFLPIPNFTNECVINIKKMIQSSNIEMYSPLFEDMKSNLISILDSIEDALIFNIANSILSTI